MANEVRFQDPGEGIHEAQVQEVLVREGDTVAEGQSVFVVETDKAAVEVPSSHAGRVEAILVSPQDQVHVGDVLMRIADAEEPAARTGEGAAEPSPTETAEAPAEAAGAEPERDAHEAVGERPAAEPGRPVPATPATRRVARELGVDLSAVEPGGENGRVTEADVRAHAGRIAAREEAAPAAASRPEAPGQETATAEGRRQPLDPVKSATARQMARAWAEIPHVTHHDRVDITQLERFRARHAAAVEAAGGKLTVTAFAMKAAAAALRDHPAFNARFDAEAQELVLLEGIHIGIALDSTRGLVVPVVRDVDRKSVTQLSVEILEMSRRLRNEAPSPQELRGGTFTITNVGAIGGTGFSPIVNHPQVAILGLARAGLEELVEGTLDEPRRAIRLVLPVCVAFDHRANDGADAARFTAAIAGLLRSPEDLALRA